MRARDLCRRDDLFMRGIGLGICDIVKDGAVEKIIFLKHNADIAAQSLLRHIAYISAVYLYRAVIDIIETHEQVYQSGFARAALADDTYHIALVYFKAYIAQDIRGILIAE